MDYHLLRAEISQQRPDLDLEAVDRAYAFSHAAHGEQKRYSGELYISHPVEVAHLLLTLKPDLPTIQAALLHDVTEDTAVTLAELEKEFGLEVATLVKGCEKLSTVRVKEEASREEDKWHKLFLAMSHDIRIVFIKLADRLHNMRTLHFVPVEKQKRIAKETMMIHAAIAGRLGIYQFKSELQDLCFRYLYPEEFKQLSEDLENYKVKSGVQMEKAVEALMALLQKEGIEFVDVQGRFKHLWSIYEKLQTKDVNRLEDLYDLLAFRIILLDRARGDREDVSHLYSTLGLLHSEYLPLQDRLKDYVAVPKPNGYRSLHTTLLGLFEEDENFPAEVQLRTERMHRESEIGVASHIDYKVTKKLNKKLDQKRHFAGRKALSHVQEILAEHPDLAGVLKAWVEDFQDLPSVRRAEVEKILLQHGLSEEEIDDINKARSQEHISLSPSLEKQLAWLKGLSKEERNLMEMELYPDRIFVMTPKRDLIELPKGATPVDFAYSIHSDLGHHLTHAKANGRIVPLDYELKNGEVVEVVTRNDSTPNPYWISFAKSTSAKSKIRAYFAKIGKDLDAEVEPPPSVIKKTTPRKTAPLKAEPQVHTVEVLVTGEQGLPLLFSACCQPAPPVPIVAFVGRGKRLRIHRQDCKELLGLEDRRLIQAHWKG